MSIAVRKVLRRHRSNQPVFHAAEKVFRVSLSLFGSGGIAAVFKRDFLQSNLDRVLGLETSRYQFSRTRGKTFRVASHVGLTVRGAIMVLELG